MQGTIRMAVHIHKPTRVEAAGQPPKSIEEFVGRINSATQEVSIARMVSPSGWTEPGQKPEFDEYTVVLRGTLHVQLEREALDIAAGQAVIVPAGEWVRYSTPAPGGAEYIAVCLPAFAPRLVHRDAEEE
jgi:mannose-6-phosphate isomerase-like protein (cupin superfamily)